ncbi:MAG: tetratricopeptide repeat protein [Pirellulales bacterium]
MNADVSDPGPISRTCAECHAELVRSYATHPMGRSLAPVDQAEPIERLGAEHQNPFERGGLRYEVKQVDSQVVHGRSVVVDANASQQGTDLHEEAVMSWAVGSGHHGRSYLFEQDGRMLMSPITWYPQQQRWDLSPGYATNNYGFQRPVTDDCLYCHANRVVQQAGQLNAYQHPVFRGGHAIGCERCHGVGERHMAAYRSTGRPPAGGDDVVDPGKLEPSLRESVCQQCHVSGAARVERRGRSRWDYQPGQLWSDYVRLFVTQSTQVSDEEFVGQAEQMVHSRCYVASAGKLGCISCHDPHRLPAAEERVAYYRARCMECHGEADCGLQPETAERHAVGDACQECHMPRRATALQHVATTNHRIPKLPPSRPADSDATSPSTTPSPAQASDEGRRGAIELFPPAQGEPTSEEDRDELQRDLAIGVVSTLGTFPELIQSSHLAEAVVQLNRAVARHADDAAAWQALAESCLRLGRLERAEVALNELLRLQPDNEYALASLALFEKNRSRWLQAEPLFRQLVRRNPADARYRHEWATCLVELGNWETSQQVVAAAVTRFPLQADLRQLQIRIDLRQERQAEADAGLQTLLLLAPEQKAEIESWYRQLAESIRRQTSRRN